VTSVSTRDRTNSGIWSSPGTKVCWYSQMVAAPASRSMPST
jgi:hypothetical protein